MNNMDNEHEHHVHGQEHNYGRYDLGLKAFVRSLQVAFLIMAVLIIGMLVYSFAIGGFKIVKPQSAMLMIRFGKVESVISKGWSWAFPRPIDEFIEIPMNQQSFSISFTAQTMPMMEGAPPPQGGPLEPGRDNYLISADANIIHTSWNVVYKISNPQKYYENVIAATAPFADKETAKTVNGEESYDGGPLVLMQNELRNVVIKVTARHKVEEALYNNQSYISDVQNGFLEAITKLDIGVEIESVTLGGAVPPQKTKAAFDEVSIARQERERMISEALTYQIQQENAASSDKVMILAEAQNYKTRIVAEIKSEAFYFNKINEEYLKSPDTVLVALYNYTLADVLASTKEKFILYKSARGNQEVRLKINPEPKKVQQTTNNQK